MNINQPILINLYGAPGSGKSTIAASLFARLKVLGIHRVELVTEFAKDLAYEDRLNHNWPLILGTQLERLLRVKDKVDVIITDSPLHLSVIYGEVSKRQVDDLMELSGLDSNTYNVFVNRGKRFAGYGRKQDEHESNVIATSLKQWLINNQIKHSEVTSTNDYTEHEKLIEYLTQDFYRGIL